MVTCTVTSATKYTCNGDGMLDVLIMLCLILIVASLLYLSRVKRLWYHYYTEDNTNE